MFGLSPKETKPRNRGRFQGVYKSHEWRKIRRFLAQQLFVCQNCGAEKATDVHHRKRLADGGEAFALENLLFLCVSCHRAAHGSNRELD